jgi:hypothetical protein
MSYDSPPPGMFPEDEPGTSRPAEVPARVRMPMTSRSLGELIDVGGRLMKPANSDVSPETWRVFTDAIWPNAKSPESIKLALDYCQARN